MIIFNHFRDLETIWRNIENPSDFQQIFSIHVFFSAKNLTWYYLIFSPENLLDNAKMSSGATIRPGKTS